MDSLKNIFPSSTSVSSAQTESYCYAVEASKKKQDNKNDDVKKKKLMTEEEVKRKINSVSCSMKPWLYKNVFIDVSGHKQNSYLLPFKIWMPRSTVWHGSKLAEMNCHMISGQVWHVTREKSYLAHYYHRNTQYQHKVCAPIEA